MLYSDYQKAIFEWVKSGTGHGAGIAVAGSSKTTSAVKSMEFINYRTSVRFNCFNKSIKDELSERTKHLLNVEVSTYNAFGLRVCRKQFGYIQLDEDKTWKAFRSICRYDESVYWKYKNIMKKLVSLSKGMSYVTVDQAMIGLDGLIDHHGLDIKDMDVFKDLFSRVYRSVIMNTSSMDFDDQVFMPVKYGLELPKTDFLIVDEWQDTNLIQYELVKRSVGKNGRVMVIGDPDQSLYGFRGAFPGIVDKFINEFSAVRLPLYICYRCKKNIVKEAQQFVPHIEPWDKAKDGYVGNIKMDEFRRNVTEDDMVLCRTNAPLIKSILWFISNGRPAFVLGREVAEQLVGLIDSICDNGWTNIDEFRPMLNDWVERTRDRLIKAEKDSAVELLDDQIDCIHAFILMDVSTVQQLKDKITSIFQEAGSGVKHMSIHKSKGLESVGNVYKLPSKSLKLKKEWMWEEERRIEYVAITRSRNDLFYVMGDNTNV